MTKRTCPLLTAAIAASLALPALAADKPLWLDPSQPAEQRARDLISRLTLEQKAQPQ